MNISWMYDFLVLAQTGNFSRAAADRNMTQPAFSRRVRALEEWLGAVLIDRSTHPATLTDTGEWFRSIAEDVTAQIGRIPEEARARARAESSTLRIACTHALSLTFLPGWLRELESEMHLGPVHLVSDLLEQCEALLQTGRVQFLVNHCRIQSSPPPNGGDSLLVGRDRLIPVCALAQDATPLYVLSEKTKAGLPILAYSPQSGIGKIIAASLGALASAASPVFTAHLASVLRSMALHGRGVAWLPESLVESDLAQARLIRTGGPEWVIDVEIRLFRSRATATPIAAAFWAAAAARVDSV